MALAIAVINALVAALPAVVGSTVTVTDGPTYTDARGDFLAVGCEDPMTTAPPTSATGETAWSDSHGRRMTEEGDVVLVAFSWSGGTDPAVPRAAVATIRDQVLEYLRTQNTPFLGVTGVYDIHPTIFSFLQAQDTDGAWAALSFHLRYRAKL